MNKVAFFDRKIISIFLKGASAFSTFIAGVVLFWDIPKEYKHNVGYMCITALLIFYVIIWVWSNKIKSIDLTVEGTTVTIKAGDIFTEPGFKAIAFNEYFDTQVDDKIIARKSLNGIFITNHCNVEKLDEYIEKYTFAREDIKEYNNDRLLGKKQKFEPGTICVWGDYLLTAFAKFNEHNEAHLTMPEYLGFLINFWDRVNRVYAQENVSVPIFGSGITRIKGHKNISDEDLLKIMLWTFRISEMRFNYPAKLTIVIHEKKINQINLFDLKSAKNGL
ncbi:hypothetical protein R9Y29_004273 [Salmonella enterica]|nr:hypothetical protein [Salmonella enterica]